MPLSNGKVANGVTHLTNGSHCRAALNSDDSQEGPACEPLLNGHHAGKRNYPISSFFDSACVNVSVSVCEMFQNGY